MLISCSKTLLRKKLKMVTDISADKHLNGGRVLRTFLIFRDCQMKSFLSSTFTRTSWFLSAFLKMLVVVR